MVTLFGFGLFKRKDPICGMKEEKGKGIEENGKWFCSKKCADEYKEAVEMSEIFNPVYDWWPKTNLPWDYGKFLSMFKNHCALLRSATCHWSLTSGF